MQGDFQICISVPLSAKISIFRSALLIFHIFSNFAKLKTTFSLERVFIDGYLKFLEADVSYKNTTNYKITIFTKERIIVCPTCSL